MAAPLAGDGPLPGAVFTDNGPSPQSIGFNEAGDQQHQQDTPPPPPLPSQTSGGSKPQIEVNSTIQIVLISLGVVVALLFLFGILAGYYIAHKNKRARQHQEALDREEEQRRQRSLKKKHIAINTILDRKGHPSDRGDATDNQRILPGGSHANASTEKGLQGPVDREANDDGHEDPSSHNGAGPRRESFLTLSPVGFGLPLWPESSTPSSGGPGVEPGTMEAALYSKEFGSQSQQGGRDESKNNKNSHLSNSNSSKTAFSNTGSASSASGLLRGTPCPPGGGGGGGIQGTSPRPSLGTTKNSFTEVAQIYAHRQSLVDPLGLQALGTVAAVSTTLSPSSGDRGPPFPSPLAPPPASSSTSSSPSSHPLLPTNNRQPLSSSSTAPSHSHDSMTLSNTTSGATLSRRTEDHDSSNTNDTSTMYETAITIPSEVYDLETKGEDSGEDSGAGVGGTVIPFNGSGETQAPPQTEESEEGIIYPKVVPRRKKSNHMHLDQQHQHQRPVDVVGYRHSVIGYGMMPPSVEISYQPPSQPTSPTSDSFDRSTRKAGLSHRGLQDSFGSGGGGGGRVGAGVGVGVGLLDSMDHHPNAVVVNVENVDENEEGLVMPQVVPRRPRTATFPHRPINYRHSQVYMHHESRPSLNINMGRRSMYGFGDLMSMSSSIESQPPFRSQAPSPPPLPAAMTAPAARPEPFTVTRSKTVYDATARMQTMSSMSATTQRLRRKWAGGEMSIETTVPTHSGIGSSVGSIHSMRRNERSFAEDDYDDLASFSRPPRGQRSVSFDRYNDDGGRASSISYRHGTSSNIGSGVGSGSGAAGGANGHGDSEHVVVSLPGPRGCLLEKDQHNAEKQFYDMMSFLQGQGDANAMGMPGKSGHMRQQSYRNPFPVPAFPQHHQRFQTYTPSKRQSYYPPSQYQQQKQTYSYERTSFDRSFPHPVQPVYQNNPSQSHRMSYVEDYYRAQQQQQQQQQQQPQQPEPAATVTPRREAGRRAQNALKRLSAVFGGGSSHASDDERNNNNNSLAASGRGTLRGDGHHHHYQDDGPADGSGQDYREGGSRRRRLRVLSDEERIKRHSIAVMNDQLVYGRPSQESFYSNAERLERQAHQQASSSVSAHHHHYQQQQQQQQQHQRSYQQQYRQESSYSARNYRTDKSRRATMYGTVSSISGRYSSDLVRQADFYADTPSEERQGYDLGMDDHDNGGYGDEHEGEDEEGGHEGGQEEEEEEDGEGDDCYYEGQEEEEHEDDEEEDEHMAEEELGYPEVAHSEHEDDDGSKKPKVMKQMLKAPNSDRPRRAPSSHGESVTVGALSSSSALDEDGGNVVKQPLKKIMNIFK